MRRIASVTLHAALAAALIAVAATPAAAVDRLKLLATVAMVAGDADRGKEKWIEIQGWDWARTAKVDGFAAKPGTARAGKKSGAVDYAWKVQEGESAPPDDHEQEMTTVAGASPPPPGGNAKFGAVSGMHRDSSRTGQVSGSGRPAADVDGNGTVDALTDGVLIMRNSATPPDRGALRVKVKFPWVGCRVGARFPGAVLENAHGIHNLSDVTVASCGPDAIALNYAKVNVRGWDPMKK